jgi:hypothetical protein
MSVISYVKDKLSDAVSLGVLLLFLIPLILAVLYGLSYYTGSNLVFYIGIYICGVLTFIPLQILIRIFLLLVNPGKYKEYQMKQFRIKREEERIKYLLILLYFLWIYPKEAEKRNKINNK